MINIGPIIVIILGLLCIIAGGCCLFMPKRVRKWIDSQSMLELRILGILISVTGALIIAQLLAFSQLFKLLITLMETVK